MASGRWMTLVPGGGSVDGLYSCVCTPVVPSARTVVVA